ncbi:MAG: hypothetical protein ACFBZ8_11805 [Opitutales bacterium]
MAIYLFRSPDKSFVLEQFCGNFDLADFQALMARLRGGGLLEGCLHTLLDLREAEVSLGLDDVEAIAREHARLLEDRSARRRIALLVDRPLPTAYAMMWRRYLPERLRAFEVYSSLEGALAHLGLTQGSLEFLRHCKPVAQFGYDNPGENSDQVDQAVG